MLIVLESVLLRSVFVFMNRVLYSRERHRSAISRSCAPNVGLHHNMISLQMKEPFMNRCLSSRSQLENMLEREKVCHAFALSDD